MKPGARVLITGGAGLVGSHIADALIEEGSAGQIIVLDNFVRGKRANLDQAMTSGLVTIVDGDIRDRDTVDALMDAVDVVFHQAAIRITQCAEDPRLAIDVMVNGTFNVLDAARRCHVGRVVAASSASVYGAADEFPTSETHHPYNDRTLYGAAKTFNEGMLRSFSDMYGLPFVALRYFNVYGPRMDVTGVYTEVLMRWMAAIVEGKAPVIHGDGSGTMDFIHVKDIARANVLAASTPAVGEVFNVASGTETSLKRLAEMLVTAMGATSVQPEHAPLRNVNPVPRRLADTSKARRLLGFESRIPLDEGLQTLVEWWTALGAQPETV
jgi:nucleoside-diphosphate-sugar epimerase